MSESDLTEYIRKDYISKGYETYAEVTLNGRGGKRCDLYARIEDINNENYNSTIVFEAKLNLNISVLNQLYSWKNHANLSYIIVPVTHKNTNIRKFARILCQKLGLGLIEVNLMKNNYNITVESEYNPNPIVPKLYEEQKEVLSSTNHTKYITSFKITLMNIDKYMSDKETASLKEIFSNIEHHYSSINSGISSIRKYIEKGIISNYVYENKFIRKI
jgi:hypothetical protein